MNRTLKILGLATSLSLALGATASAHEGEQHKESAGHGHAEKGKEKEKTPAAAAGTSTIDIAGHVAKLETAGDDITVTITEKDGAPPESATDAKLILQVGAEKKTISLDGKDGKFTGKADLKGATKFVAVLQLKLDGKSRTGRFNVDSAAAAAHSEAHP